MPCLRGIEVSLTDKFANEPISEYPHPEGSSVSVVGGQDLRKHVSPSKDSDCSSTPYRKTNPTVSVYVASIPETPFSINYRVNQVPPAPSRYIFFKLYMNGRLVAAWGIDTNVKLRGQVVKSLWVPSGRYNDLVGLEERSFVFLPKQENQSVAEDGGLIEIHAFRAKGGRSRVPKLQEFRYQENCRIAAPSIGLLDQPQDAIFYDWHLTDPKDSPYATFRLHYRSWPNLKDLNLMRSNRGDIDSQNPVGSVIRRADDYRKKQLRSPESGLSYHPVSTDDKVFDGSPPAFTKYPHKDKASYFLKSPPELFPATVAINATPQPSKVFRDGYQESYLQRPLPQLPMDESLEAQKRCSVASICSVTPSLTPSLMQYVDEGSFDVDVVEIGVAQAVLMQLKDKEPTTEGKEGFNEVHSADYWVSNYEGSPASTNSSPMNATLPPPRYPTAAGSMVERNFDILASYDEIADSQAVQPKKRLNAFYRSEINLAKLRTLQMSGPESVQRSPSPARSDSANPAPCV